ncbi:MAG: 4-(cytidine 5'-diphospho)-2-C-methyl-D-erythritol kinase [Acidobacteria bacterium]|nr:4-(cytidine 5'-diphospho)-2-C-methyl-D-erythritol kinase [Acidobacteriota bacterium]
MPATRVVRVNAFAKLNLCLSVLYKRPDGYHEIRSVFQTVSLADRLRIEFTPARRTRIEAVCQIDIPGNLAVRAAQALFDNAKITGSVDIRLGKRIPIGGGLGGGSSDAAAVLLALPSLTGRRIDPELIHRTAASLGSDVPFFLTGGTAIGTGRGDELYPLADLTAPCAIIAAPGLPVSTPDAYRALARPEFTGLTPDALANKMREFRAFSRALDGSGEWGAFAVNDFEPAVFPRHPEIQRLWRSLRRSGASPARMSGSGSALFGVFASPDSRDKAAESLRSAYPKASVHSIRFISRRHYRATWLRSLSPYCAPGEWPPQPR